MILGFAREFVRILVSFVVCGSRERSSLVGLRALERHFRIITSGTLGAFVECN